MIHTNKTKEFLKLIIEEKADLSLRTKDNKSALEIAIEKTSVDMIDILLESIVDDNNEYNLDQENNLLQVKDKDNNNILHLLSKSPAYFHNIQFILSVINKDNHYIDLLYQRNNDGYIPFHLAVCSDTHEAVKLFLDFEVSQLNNENNNNVEEKINNNENDKSKYHSLLTHKDSNDNTAIDISLINQSLYSLANILEHYRINLFPKYQNDDLKEFNETIHFDKKSILSFKNQERVNIVLKSSEIGCRSLISEILQFNDYKEENYSPLNLCSFLLTSFIDDSEFGVDGNSIHMTCRFNHHNLLALILDYLKNNSNSIEDKNYINSNSNYCEYTPLHFACLGGSFECLTLLLEQPNLNLIPFSEKTEESAMDCALQSGCNKTVTLIRKRILAYRKEQKEKKQQQSQQ
eukprot:TRINITY_DN3745_c0_g2_i1.p1 TRINITY_DN3745_c0_g2~~TRINITY_DN3745_c0_g2_i1.p1  ORF type:complete len:405 (+),score=102.12 TRINITY_DN3745_c0_g2_i1:32-1246(+)